MAKSRESGPGDDSPDRKTSTRCYLSCRMLIASCAKMAGYKTVEDFLRSYLEPALTELHATLNERIGRGAAAGNEGRLNGHDPAKLNVGLAAIAGMKEREGRAKKK
jgi:hypothetical protein